MAELKECRVCHRVGFNGFCPEGDCGWVCIDDWACKRRLVGREDEGLQREKTPPHRWG